MKQLFKILFIDPSDHSIIQFIRYGLVGGVAAVVNIGLLYVFTDLCHIYYIISNILAFLSGLIVNYFLSKIYVFKQDVSFSKKLEFMIYAIIGMFGLCVDTGLIWLFTSVISIHYMISKIISTAIVFVWNFGARKILYRLIERRQ